MNAIYILLTRSDTALSHMVRATTGDEYTHVSIAFDENLQSLCSFARLVPFLPLPSGLTSERLYSGYFGAHPNTHCALYRLSVPQAVFDAAKNHVARMMSVRHRYRYSVKGLLLCRAGIAQERENYYFCSQFVAQTLQRSGAAVLPKPPSLMRPQDIALLPGLVCCYHGEIGALWAMMLQTQKRGGCQALA